MKKVLHVTINGEEYEMIIHLDTVVSIYCNGVWVGDGVWNGQQIDDCAATLPDETYTILDDAIMESM